MNDTSKELIAAVYSLDPVQSGDTVELQRKKDELTRDLQRFINSADTVDYSVAIGSGIVCGLLDSLFVGEFSVTKQDIELSHETINRFIQKTAEGIGYKGNRLAGAVQKIEEKFPAPQDDVWKGANIGVGAKNHHLADFAHHPTLLGLISAIIVQFLRVGIFANKDGKIYVLPVRTEPKVLIETWTPVVIAGICSWLAAIIENGYETETESDLPKSIKAIVHLAASTPAIIQVLKIAGNWTGHLISDMAGSKNTAGKGMGIPGVFLSLAYEIASLPPFNTTGLPKQLNDLYVKHKQDFRHELPGLKMLGKQALVVILNEAIVRSFYFIRRLAIQAKENGIANIDWNQVIPFDNKTILRMTTISSASFVAVDLTDAAIRGAIESEGNWVIFAARFASRINVVGAGRLAISVVAEAKMESDELQVLRERRIVSEELSARNIDAIVAYRERIAALVEQYLADDLEAFLTGMETLKTGLEEGNAEKVIAGNVAIQRKLGREVQFCNQNEFDALMLSNEAFKL